MTAEARLRVPFVAAASLRAGAVDIIAVVDIVVDVGRGDASLRQPREGLFAREAFERGWFRRARVLVDARGRRRTNLSTRRKSHTRVSYWSAISRTPKSSPRPNPLLGPALGGSPAHPSAPPRGRLAMGKKGVKKKGGAKKSGAEPDPFARPEVSDGALEVGEREVDIGHLKRELGAFQDASATLAIQNEALRSAVSRELEDAKDVNDYLTAELLAKDSEMAALLADVASREEQIRVARDTMEARVAAAVETSEAETKVLLDELALLRDQEESVRARQAERARILDGLERVSQLLAAESHAQKSNLADAEGRHLRDKAQLRAEMDLTIRETALSLTRLTDERLVVTTKRAIMENESKRASLGERTRTVERTSRAHEVLAAGRRVATLDAETAARTVDEMRARERVLTRRAMGLTARLRAIEDARRAAERDANEGEREYDDAAAEIGRIRRRRPATLAALAAAEKERDATTRVADALRERTGTRREDVACVVARNLGHFVARLGTTKREPSKSAAKSAAKSDALNDASASSSEDDDVSRLAGRRTLRLSDLNRRQRAAAVDFLMAELRKTRDEGDTGYFGGVGGARPDPKLRNKVAKGPREVRVETTREAVAPETAPIPSDARSTRPPRAEVPDSVRRLVGMKPAAKAHNLPPVPTIESRWGWML